MCAHRAVYFMPRPQTFSLDALQTRQLADDIFKRLPASYAQEAEAGQAFDVVIAFIDDVTAALDGMYQTASSVPEWVFRPDKAREGQALEALLYYVACGFQVSSIRSRGTKIHNDLSTPIADVPASPSSSTKASRTRQRRPCAKQTMVRSSYFLQLWRPGRNSLHPDAKVCMEL